MDAERLKTIVEGALLAAGQPLSLSQLNSLFDEDQQPGHGLLRQALSALDAELEQRAVELVETGSGYRLQIRQSLMPTVSNLWREKPPRYSRALLETLAIIAYRQPITRGEIEQIRGVSLSANILKTLQERDWIKTVGHRDVPGKPELLGTTKVFLDYFNLKGLDDLPTLAEIRDLDNLEPELELNDPDGPVPDTEQNSESSTADQGSTTDTPEARHDAEQQDDPHADGQASPVSDSSTSQQDNNEQTQSPEASSQQPS